MFGVLGLFAALVLLALGSCQPGPVDPEPGSGPGDTDRPTDGGADAGRADSGSADTGGGTGSPPACTPTSDASVTLCADRFWAQALDPTSSAELDAALGAMPLDLQVTGLGDAGDRARQLQWALVAANALSAPSVALLVPDGVYDFTGLDDAHPSVPTADVYQQPLRPKLFVRRDDITLRRAAADASPVLTARGPGADGLHHGRVFLLLDSSATRLTVDGLTFRGDATPDTFTDPARFLHENDAGLYWAAQWGAAMVGLNGGANHATFRDCRFEQVNGSAISAVGLLTVEQSVFEGALPDPTVADPELATETLHDAITAARGASPGMDFHAAIRRSYAYGPTVVTDSTFSDFVQGIVMSADGFSLTVTGSRFTALYDHAIYVLGDADGSLIEDNDFIGVGNGALKFAGHTESSDPAESRAGLRNGALRDNRFGQMRNGALQLSGTGNDVARNIVYAYDPADDPTGWYDPDDRPGDRYPEAFCITEAGQAGWANHIAGNTFTDNIADDGSFDIFLQQRPTVPDRSISGNRVSGAGQTVYFRHLLPCDSSPAPCSSYTPEITAEFGAVLVIGAPDDCAACYPDDPGYIEELP